MNNKEKDTFKTDLYGGYDPIGWVINQHPCVGTAAIMGVLFVGLIIMALVDGKMQY
jgi:predicted acyl esterase